MDFSFDLVTGLLIEQWFVSVDGPGVKSPDEEGNDIEVERREQILKPRTIVPDTTAFNSVSPTGVFTLDLQSIDRADLSIDTDGSFTFAPEESHSGSFGHRATGGDMVTEAIVVTFEIYAVNDLPVADAGPDQTGTTAVECISAIGTQVTLDGSGSSDPDGDSLTYSWAENGVEIATGVEPTVQLGIGSHTITLIVDDGNSGSTSDDITIDIVDTTPPDVTVTATPQVLGPANQEYHNVVLSVTAADACDPSVLTFLATAATSDADDAQEKGKGEGTSNGDGETKGDIRVTKPDESVIQSSNEEPEVTFDPVSDMLELRAVHSGNGDGRTYTITLTVTDAQGNESTPVVVEVKVEHDQLSEPDVTKSALTKPAFSDADVSTDGLAFGLDQNYPNPFNLQRP